MSYFQCLEQIFEPKCRPDLPEDDFNVKSGLVMKASKCLFWTISKEVLWVSVDQLVSKLQAVKVGCLKKILLCSMSRDGPGSTPGLWDHPPTLTACNFTAT